jgi:hypothetical protein
MTTSTLPLDRPRAQAWPRRLLSGLEPVMGATGLALILSLALTLPAWWIDTRTFQGDSVWLKPIKFQIALILYTLTLAWFARWVEPGRMRRPWVRLSLVAGAASVALEMAWIGGAAMFATASHYSTLPVMDAIYPLMGLVAIQLTSVSLVLGLALWRSGAHDLAPATHLGLVLGLVMTCVLTLVAVVPLASGTGHFVGLPQTGAAVPILGWSREVGDLRVAHFLATHALHALPLVGLAAARWLSDGVARRLVWAAGVVYAAAVVATLAQALAGLPLLALG